MSIELDEERNESSYSPPDDFPSQSGSRRRTTRAVAWIAGIVLILGLAGLLIWRHAHAIPAMKYETVTVDRGTIAAKVTATGNLSALLTVQVGSQVSGRVQELLVDYNSPVRKGQVIARLDPLIFKAAVEQARANLLGAQSNMKKDQAQEGNAKAILERSKSLMAAQLIAQSDFDTVAANYDAAKAQVDADESNLESLRAMLNQTEVNLSYTTIVSPIDGTVISRSVDVGQTVAASFQSPTLFVIARDLRVMQVDTNVGEADVGRLTPGMPASFTVDAYPNRPFVGTLRQIRNASQTVQNVVTYDAVIDVLNPELLLRPGMTANCTFIAAQKDNVVRLRNAALRFQPDPLLLKRIGITAQDEPSASVNDPNRRIVWLLRGDKPAHVSVVTGVTDGTRTELVEGDVKPGDVLITDMAVNPPRGIF